MVVDIQIDEGEFTRIHNEILCALAKARLSGAEFRCVLFLLRKTYGWQKKEDKISLSQWAEGMDSKRPHVLTTLNELVKKNIIYRRMDGGQIPTYGFNKHFDQWTGIEVDAERGKRFKNVEVLPEQEPLPGQVTVTSAGNTTVTKAGNATVTSAGTHKRKKETIKENNPEQKIMFGELARICRVDPKLKAGQIGKTAKALLSANYCAADIAGFIGWWNANDWRGKRGSPPTLAQVLDNICQSKNYQVQEFHPAETY
jgi:phage replication O-like protein O